MVPIQHIIVLRTIYSSVIFFIDFRLQDITPKLLSLAFLGRYLGFIKKNINFQLYIPYTYMIRSHHVQFIKMAYPIYIASFPI